MKIITIGNTKGGVGKSTIAANLAVAASRDGLKVLLVDADPQGSSMGFRSIRESDDIKATGITAPTLHKDVREFSNFDLILIDAGGRDSAVFRSAIMAADLFLIPVLPSVYDIWASEDTINTLREARSFKDLKARFLINMVIPRTIMAREAAEAIAQFTDEAPVLATRLTALEAHKKCILHGKGVLEFEPNGKAAREIQSLYAEIMAGG